MLATLVGNENREMNAKIKEKSETKETREILEKKWWKEDKHTNTIMKEVCISNSGPSRGQISNSYGHHPRQKPVLFQNSWT